MDEESCLGFDSSRQMFGRNQSPRQNAEQVYKNGLGKPPLYKKFKNEKETAA